MVDDYTSTRIAKALANRGMAIGTWAFLNSPEVCEIAGMAGFDFILINMEHGLLGIESVVQMIRAAEGRGIDSIIRLPDGSAPMIAKVLDAGASGIFIPGVLTAKQATDIVKAAKFPPHGNRGFSPTTRATGYGMKSAADYRNWNNQNIQVWITIENKEALKNLASIMKSGVDGVITGRYDLSVSMGLNDANHPKIQKIIDRVTASASKNGVGVIGSHVQLDTPEKMLAAARSWKARGARYMIFGKDCTILAETYKTVVSTFRDARL